MIEKKKIHLNAKGLKTKNGKQMVSFNILKCDITNVFIEANKRDLKYKELKNSFEVHCDHMTQCTCRRLEKINRVIENINGYIPKDIKTIATMSTNINISEDYIINIDDFHIKNPTYLIQIINFITHEEISITSTVYKYKVFTNKINSIDSLLDSIKTFEYQKIKLPLFIIDKIGVEIADNYLSDFQINMEHYEFRLLRYDDDRDSYIGEFRNPRKGRSIIVDKIIINEMDGSVYSCGNDQYSINF